jgi:uncharacterized membrane protein
MYSIAKCIKSRYNDAYLDKWYIISKIGDNYYFINNKDKLKKCNEILKGWDCEIVKLIEYNNYYFDLDNIITIGDSVSSIGETVTGKFVAFKPNHNFPFGIQEGLKIVWVNNIKKLSNIKNIN